MSLLRYIKCNNGMGMMEVLISLFLTSVAVMAIFSLMAPGWRTTARADYMGRATEILSRQLEVSEAHIMNSCNTLAEPAIGLPAIPAVNNAATSAYNVITSGSGAAISGDSTFTVATTITCVSLNYYRVLVNVSWPGNAAGVFQSVYVSRQHYFRTGC